MTKINFVLKKRNVGNRVRPERLRQYYAALATAPDEERFPLIVKHFPGPSRQQLLKMIAREERAWRMS